MWQYKSILQYRMFGTCVINYHWKNFEQRATIKYYCKAGFTAAKMWEMFVKEFGDSSVSHATVFWWRFAAGEESIEDTEWSRRMGTMKTYENIAWVAAVLKDDGRASCRMMAESMGILKTIVHRILSDYLKKRKLCAWFVPHVLTTEQWEQRIVHTKDLTISYSLDLSPPDYFAFLKLKMELKGDQYATVSDIQTSVTMKLKTTIPITDFSWAMHRLEDRPNQCTAVNEDYFE